MHQDQSHMWTFGRTSWGSAYASLGKCAGSRYQRTVGWMETRMPTPSPTRAGSTALFICFLWRRVGLRGPRTRTRVFARHMIWSRTIPFWSRWRGWSPWRTALITTRTRTGGGMGKGGYRGRDPAPPSSVPAGLLVPSVGVVGRHVAAPLGEPDPEFRIWVQLTPPPPPYLRPPVWCWTVLVCGLCFTTWANAPVARHRARRSARRKGKGGSSDCSGSMPSGSRRGCARRATAPGWSPRPSPRTRGSRLWPSWSGNLWTPWSATPPGKCRPRTRRRHTPCSVSSSCLSRRDPPAGYGPPSLCRSPTEGPTWACGSGCKAGLRW